MIKKKKIKFKLTLECRKESYKDFKDIYEEMEGIMLEALNNWLFNNKDFYNDKWYFI